MVVERSNALFYLMSSTLELKVEGSNPGTAVPFLGRQFSSENENELIRVFSRVNSRNLDFRYKGLFIICQLHLLSDQTFREASAETQRPISNMLKIGRHPKSRTQIEGLEE